MESDLGKLFIGGISWDTDENKLKKYFGQYGEIIEAVIMRDRLTGRARGFGFIIFADPSVAERVVLDKHMIDGRTVEAKKAVPRDDQQMLGRNNSSVSGSPGPGRTKKIFVGGLASSVTESDFKNYFDQFGTITDVVVMYDHNTQRPRGFGFITYDSEEAVDRVLHKTFHELNGKMVEVKRAVPKELSPGPSRSPLVGYNYGLTRAANFINNYAQGFNLSPYASRTGLPPFSNPGYGMNMNMNMNVEAGLNPGYGANASFGNNQEYGRVLGSFYGGNSNRYTTPIGYNVGTARDDSLFNSAARNVWGNGLLTHSKNPSNPSAFLGSGSANLGFSTGNNGPNWGIPSAASLGGNNNNNNNNNNSSVYNTSGNIGYGVGDGNYRLGGGVYGRTQGADGAPLSSFTASTGGFDTSYGDLYRTGSGYGDSAWRSDSAQLDASASFGFGIANAAQDVTSKTSEDFIGSYGVTNRQANRGIAA